MLNYIKSEWYRLTHTKELWVYTAAASGLVLLMNVVLAVCQAKLPGFRYGVVRFSLSFLTSGMMILCYAGMFWAWGLFAGQKRNGVIKNAVAYGISRSEIFVGNCVVCGGAALFSMAVITAVWIGSAVLLLDGQASPYVEIMLRGMAAQLPFAVASVILFLGLLQYLEKDASALLIWMSVLVFIPKVILLAGLRIPVLGRIAGWMPEGYLSTEVFVNLSGRWECLWMNGPGLAKCLAAGFIGIGVFLTGGILLNRRKAL